MGTNNPTTAFNNPMQGTKPYIRPSPKGQGTGYWYEPYEGRAMTDLRKKAKGRKQGLGKPMKVFQRGGDVSGGAM